ncbi:metal-dependent hydrolase [Nanoarchaeota archaeon]
MNFMSHMSYPALLFVIISKLFGITYSISDLLILILFAALPDFDFLFHRLVKRGKFDAGFRHHDWFTHWPITYLPLVVLLIIFPTFKMLLAVLGLYSHFVLDLFLGNGIMWFYPFSKKKYGFFKITGCHGWDWFKVYRGKLIYKFDVIATIAIIVIVILKSL